MKTVKISAKAKKVSKKLLAVMAANKKKAEGVMKGLKRTKLAPTTSLKVISPKIHSKKTPSEVGKYRKGSGIEILYSRLISGKKFGKKQLEHGVEMFGHSLNRLARHGLESKCWTIKRDGNNFWMDKSAKFHPAKKAA